MTTGRCCGKILDNKSMDKDTGRSVHGFQRVAVWCEATAAISSYHLRAALPKYQVGCAGVSAVIKGNSVIGAANEWYNVTVIGFISLQMKPFFCFHRINERGNSNGTTIQIHRRTT